MQVHEPKLYEGAANFKLTRMEASSGGHSGCTYMTMTRPCQGFCSDFFDRGNRPASGRSRGARRDGEQ